MKVDNFHLKMIKTILAVLNVYPPTTDGSRSVTVFSIGGTDSHGPRDWQGGNACIGCEFRKHDESA